MTPDIFGRQEPPAVGIYRDFLPHNSVHMSNVQPLFLVGMLVS